MKRTWSSTVALVACVLCGMTATTCLAAGGKGGLSAAAMRMGGGNHSSPQRLRTPQLQPKFTGGSTPVLRGGSLQASPFKPNFPTLPVGGNKSPKPIPPGGPIVAQPLPIKPIKPFPIKPIGTPVTPTFPIKPIGPLPVQPTFPVKPIKPIGPITPVTPVFPIKPLPLPPLTPCPKPPICPPYCPPPPHCPAPCYPGWCYSPCAPIIIPIGGFGFGGGYGGGTVVTETVVVEAPAVVTPVAEAVAAPVAEEKLMQVPAGATLTLSGKDLGEKPGQVLVQLEKLSFPALVNEWKPDHVTTTLPMMGLAGPIKAQIFVLKEGGEVGSAVPVELIPAEKTP